MNIKNRSNEIFIDAKRIREFQSMIRIFIIEQGILRSLTLDANVFVQYNTPGKIHSGTDTL